MRFEPTLVRGTLLKRYKRFLADVRLEDGTEVTAHCPNPGSMKTCAEPGWTVWLSPATNPKRKLKWTWELADTGKAWILVNTARPNAIVREAIEAGQVPRLSGYPTVRPEVRYGLNSRIDLLLQGPDRPDCWVEIKNVTLAHAPGVAAFPDSVTARGAKHMAELAKMAQAGDRAVVFFLVSRTDATAMVPADHIDPTYGRALRDAIAAGVEVIAHRAEIGVEGIGVGAAVPVEMG